MDQMRAVMKAAPILLAQLFLLAGCQYEAQQSAPDGNIYFDRAESDLRFGDANKAVANYTEAIRLFSASRNPKLGEAYVGRAMAYSRLVKNAEADRDLQEAARLGYTVRHP